MKHKTASLDFTQIYREFFRIHAHQLIAWGYERAKAFLLTDDEEEISDILYQNIQNLLIVQRESWMANYAIKNEDPISGGAKKGKSRNEIDFIVELTGQGRPQYVFEAKCLNWSKDYQHTGNYLNKKGLGRFLRGEYADYTSRFPEIGMLGYVLSDSVEVWQGKLKKDIDKKRVELRLENLEDNVPVIAEIPYEWTSSHRRDSSSLPVKIFHILLDCR